MPNSVLGVANALLLMADGVGEPLSNMKLQKMLYYEQGYHLAYFDSPLFPDNFEAWLYGPVVPRVYDKFKSYGNGLIPPGRGAAELALTGDERNLFEQVFHVYSAYSAIGLMRLTHKEAPWRNADCRKNETISKESIMEFFKEKIKH